MRRWRRSFQEVLDRPIQFIDVPEHAMRQAFAGLAFPEWQAEGVIEDYEHYRRGEAETISSAVAAITGSPPHSLATFVRDYNQAFGVS
jgi:hypothetical protein